MKPFLETKGGNNTFAVCDYCLSSADHNKEGVFEEMLFCKDCQAKAHPSCMNYSKALAEGAYSYPWQCIECKTCTICCSAQDGESILFCDGCDKAYHMKCHQPQVNTKPDGKWICSACSIKKPYTNGFDKVVNNHLGEKNDNGTSKCDSPNENMMSNLLDDKQSLSREKEDVFNAAEWTAEQVSDYFKDIGFSEQAHVFIEEEIDGKSLLLLKRADVVSGLRLKLGPAVKIYHHIIKLQKTSLSFNYQNGF